MLKIVEIKNQAEWDDFIDSTGGHPLQSWGWGELKKEHHWDVKRIFIRSTTKKYAEHKKSDNRDVVAAAQILTRKLPWPLNNFAYIPRGAHILSKKPAERAKMMREITDYCAKNIKPKPVCLSIEPDWNDFPPQLLKEQGWKTAKNTILLPKTILIDLKKSDEELFKEMSKKTRQYIRKSSDEISVRPIEHDVDFEECLKIYEETAARAGFNIHSRQYYQDLRRILGDNAPVYGAYAPAIEPEQNGEQSEQVETDIDIEIKGTLGKPSSEQVDLERIYGSKLARKQELVAFLWPIKSGKIAFELYGGVTERGQETRANYILKWLTIKQMQSAGVGQYDVNGLLNDGISNFKRGFAKHEDTFCGTYDKPLSPLYFVWAHLLPLGKRIIRKFKL